MDGRIVVQLPPDADPELLRRLAEAFPEAGLVTEPDAAAVAADQRLAAAFDAADALPARLQAFAEGLAPAGGVAVAVLLVALTLALGAAAAAGARRLLPRRPARPKEARFTTRLRRALTHFVRRLLTLVVFAAGSFLCACVLLPDVGTARLFFGATLSAVLFVGSLHAVSETILAPSAPERRPIGLSTREAHLVLRSVEIWLAFVAALRLTESVLESAAGAAGAVVVAALALANAGIAILVFRLVRHPIGLLIARSLPAGTAGGWRSRLASDWWIAYAALAAANGLVVASAALGLIGPEARQSSGGSLAILILAPLAVAGLRAWRADARAPRSDLAVAGFAAAEGATVLAAAALLLRAWGVDLAETESTGWAVVLPRLIAAGAVVVVGFALWRAAEAALRRRVGGRAEGEIPDEERLRAATRLETVLPVAGGFLFALIAVVTALTAVSALGVDVAPLIAGAGVMGIAIGFGAQKLVADVISGLFYLYEDAFRLGEYVETAEGKGVVERISLRSARLRHHRGPVFTIPFSSMGTIQNHSRDWVKVKFTFAVRVETDVELVRKLVKKVGEALLAEPELEGKFIEPLKSQGAIAIRNDAFEIGCKFTCRPGDQFLIRRKALAALQKTLNDKGIDLYAPRIALGAGEESSGLTAITR